MSSIGRNLILAYHGCEKQIGLNLVNQTTFPEASKNSYDWLGTGMYFWEGSESRAWDFINNLKENPNPQKKSIIEPFVIGAVLDLKNCLDLTDSKSIRYVKAGYEFYKDDLEASDTKILENKDPIKSESKDKLLRHLDCKVINVTCSLQEDSGTMFDSVRSVFFEGDELYEKAGFYEKTHIQIAVRNFDCIKGFFLPR